MEKCVYCGKNITGRRHQAKAHTRYFDVCGNQCKHDLGSYLERDKRLKLPMFLLIFAGGIGFLLSALTGKGQYGMLPAYIGQMMGGIAFILFPYPVLSFETFLAVSVKKMTVICRWIGLLLIGFGMVLIGHMVWA